MSLWDVVVFLLFDLRPDIVIIAVTVVLGIGACVATVLDWVIARTVHRR